MSSLMRNRQKLRNNMTSLKKDVIQKYMHSGELHSMYGPRCIVHNIVFCLVCDFQSRKNKTVILPYCKMDSSHPHSPLILLLSLVLALSPKRLQRAERFNFAFRTCHLFAESIHSLPSLLLLLAVIMSFLQPLISTIYKGLIHSFENMRFLPCIFAIILLLNGP